MKFSADNLRTTCEKGREVGKSTTHHLSVTGEPYVVIGHQIALPSEPGVVAEGEAQESAFDAETAYFSALSAFKLYADGRPGRLYWRIKPHLQWDNKVRRCRYYMRLLISDCVEAS